MKIYGVYFFKYYLKIFCFICSQSFSIQFLVDCIDKHKDMNTWREKIQTFGLKLQSTYFENALYTNGRQMQWC